MKEKVSGPGVGREATRYQDVYKINKNQSEAPTYEKHFSALIWIYGSAINPQYKARPAESLRKFLHHQNRAILLLNENSIETVSNSANWMDANAELFIL